ncbi:MAG: hypothetical protein BWY06_01699 [Candidatus Latescibacteria bacterium ADurb.Bin168]|nr:MAG: hypothetical protein BWY06_01699 [Candidatus Latescibacteria bacterium ADurb.Bin168]
MGYRPPGCVRRIVPDRSIEPREARVQPVHRVYLRVFGSVRIHEAKRLMSYYCRSARADVGNSPQHSRNPEAVVPHEPPEEREPVLSGECSVFRDLCSEQGIKPQRLVHFAIVLGLVPDVPPDHGGILGYRPGRIAQRAPYPRNVQVLAFPLSIHVGMVGQVGKPRSVRSAGRRKTMPFILEIGPERGHDHVNSRGFYAVVAVIVDTERPVIGGEPIGSARCCEAWNRIGGIVRRRRITPDADENCGPGIRNVCASNEGEEGVQEKA